MSKHTPGPWKVSEKKANGTKAYVEGAAGYVVAQSYCLPSTNIKYNDLWAEAEANARLIAAAPELLECLRELYAIVRGECPRLLDEDIGGNGELELAIVDAIAKASSSSSSIQEKSE